MPQRDRLHDHVPAGAGLRPASAEGLVRVQNTLAQASPTPWRPGGGPLAVGGCFVVFQRSLSGAGAEGDPAVAGTAVVRECKPAGSTSVKGRAGAPYEPGLLFLREEALLEAAVRGLPERPDVLLVNGTGRDHPRRAGLAVHLGALLDLPTAGVTHQPLRSEGPWPDDQRGSMSPIMLEGDVVGYWLRTRRGVRPLVVHSAWRTTPEAAARVVLASTQQARTPEPLRLARQAVRAARASETGPGEKEGVLPSSQKECRMSRKR